MIQNKEFIIGIGLTQLWELNPWKVLQLMVGLNQEEKPYMKQGKTRTNESHTDKLKPMGTN